MARFETVSLMRPSCSAGVSPSGLRSVMPSRTWALMPATRTMKNSSRLLAEIDRNRTRSSAGWPVLTESSSTRRLKCSQESSRLMKRSGLWAIVGPRSTSASFSFITTACADSMKFNLSQGGRQRNSGRGGARMCYRDDVSMTLTFPPRAPPIRRCLPQSGAAQKFRSQRPGHRPAQTQGFAVQQFDSPPNRRIGPLDARCQIADHALIDRQLAVLAKLDDQRAEQLI